MAFVLEDGSGVVGANAYIPEDFLDAYVEDRGYTQAAGDAEAAIVRASQSLDATYRDRFPGERAFGRDQGLEWPRVGATDRNGEAIEENVVPYEVENATAELALKELASPGSTLPDLERGGDIRSLRAGSVQIQYGTGAPPGSTFQLVDGILSSLLIGSDDGLSAVALRG